MTSRDQRLRVLLGDPDDMPPDAARGRIREAIAILDSPEPARPEPDVETTAVELALDAEGVVDLRRLMLGEYAPGDLTFARGWDRARARMEARLAGPATGEEEP